MWINPRRGRIKSSHELVFYSSLSLRLSFFLNLIFFICKTQPKWLSVHNNIPRGQTADKSSLEQPMPLCLLYDIQHILMRLKLILFLFCSRPSLHSSTQQIQSPLHVQEKKEFLLENQLGIGSSRGCPVNPVTPSTNWLISRCYETESSLSPAMSTNRIQHHHLVRDNWH